LNNVLEHQKWTSASSIHTMEFERKPVLEDISIVIPTLGRDILEQSLFWILSGGHVARMFDRGRTGSESQCSKDVETRAGDRRPREAHPFESARAFGGHQSRTRVGGYAFRRDHGRRLFCRGGMDG
jgi:hypothetical protein